MLLDIVGSKVRFAVLISLVKAYNLGVSVTPRSIARVFGLNLPETYRFTKKLVDEGFAKKLVSGYTLTRKGSKLVDFVLETLPKLGDGLDWLRIKVPDTMYYVFLPPFQSWFGISKLIIIIDKSIKKLISRNDFKILYQPMRGKIF